MKKTQTALQWKRRRLSLNRETIHVLNDPAILELARAGMNSDLTTLTKPTTQESTSQRPGTGTATGC